MTTGPALLPELHEVLSDAVYVPAAFAAAQEEESVNQQIVGKKWGSRWCCAILGLLALSVGCSDDPPWPTCPTGPANNAGTTANTAGTSSNSDDGGAPPENAGGMDDGGRAPTGGRAGTNNGGGNSGGSAGTGGSGNTSGSAGTGGGGTASNLCGNSMIDGTESCDDGNTKYGDMCAGNCSNKGCEACQQESCWSSVDTLAPALDLCFNDPDGVAVDGPKATSPLRELCADLYKCSRESGCLTDPAFPIGIGLGSRCYCGTATENECRIGGPLGLGEPKGPCVNEFQAAAETRDYATLAGRFTNPAFALGRWSFAANSCDYQMCGLECSAGKKKDTCETCAVGTYDDGRGALLSDCMIGKSKDKCPAVIACARETGCLKPGTQPLDALGVCYGDGAGPCHGAIEAIADSTDIATVKVALASNAGPAATVFKDATALLVVMAANCSAECFTAP